MKANSNQSVIAHLRRRKAPASTWSRRANCAARSPPAAPPERIVFAGVGKTAREIALALDTGIFCFNVESEPELDADLGDRHGQGADRRDRDPHQSRRRRQDPRQDHHRQGREQVRHPLRPGARGLCPRRRPARHPGRRRRHAYRQPDHRPRPLSTRPMSASPIWSATLRADGHAIDHVDAGGGLGIPYRLDDPPPPEPAAYGEIVRRRLGNLGAPHPVRAGPALRRQCRHPRHRGRSM